MPATEHAAASRSLRLRLLVPTVKHAHVLRLADTCFHFRLDHLLLVVGQNSFCPLTGISRDARRVAGRHPAGFVFVRGQRDFPVMKLRNRPFAIGGRHVTGEPTFNLCNLARAAAEFISTHPDVWFLVVGDGESVDSVRAIASDSGVADRLVVTGSLSGGDVAEAYAAMDVFGFASSTETQGIVLVEGLCAGVPIVATDGPGTRDILTDETGILLPGDASTRDFAEALNDMHRDSDRRSQLREAAERRGRKFERKRCAQRLLRIYRQVTHQKPVRRTGPDDPWTGLQDRFEAEWDLFRTKFAVITDAMSS